MAYNKIKNEAKQDELTKYRKLVLATLDYYIDNNEAKIGISGFDNHEHFKTLKFQTDEIYRKGQLSKLKRWLRDLTEMYVETGDIKFYNYLRNSTMLDFDIFDSYFKRVENIIKQGKIKTDNQFYDIEIMVEKLRQTNFIAVEKIEILNQFLQNYELRKLNQNRQS